MPGVHVLRVYSRDTYIKDACRGYSKVDAFEAARPFLFN